MISIVITSSKEPKTIGRAIESFLTQKIMTKYEIIIVAPDEPTLNIAKSYSKKYKMIKYIRDKGIGKPAALNEAFKKIRGDLVILTDGDVFVDKDSVNILIGHFKDPQVGAVTGRIISLNDTKSMFGYWAEILTEGFHNLRRQEVRRKGFTICSGYFYAVRKILLPTLPHNVLADDAYISENVIIRGYKINYEPLAKVFVFYPTNLIDWIRQKKRTASRIYQSSSSITHTKISTLTDEFLAGIITLKKIKSFKHVVWFAFLIVMRLYIWFRIFFDFRLWNRPINKAWQRVQSTK